MYAVLSELPDCVSISGSLIQSLLSSSLINNRSVLGENPRAGVGAFGTRATDGAWIWLRAAFAMRRAIEMSAFPGVFTKSIRLALSGCLILNALHRGDLLRVLTNALLFGRNIRLPDIYGGGLKAFAGIDTTIR
ncbi:hypothetical protein C2L64_47310 [Paraburkholderia hospita]|uniref:Uncharacterized protein n=1 Tax=Paraburkholderia hospita TaxID=169430 RepID=A0AAN1MQK6_9BURK|nr:hypothetical protein C2L64_47310 [Paraburkholderia hospita]